MSDDIIRIKFGVKGGKGFLEGTSGASIKEDLLALAEKIHPKVKVVVDKNDFKRQLTSLQKELQKTLGTISVNVKTNNEIPKTISGKNSSKTAVKEEIVTYQTLRNTLEKLYQTKVKVEKLSVSGNSKTVDGTLLKEKTEELKSSYESQLKVLKEKDGLEKQEIKNIQNLKDELEGVYKKQIAVMSTPKKASEMSLEKLRDKAASLYNTNGFDKIIARSEEAAKLVNDFNAKIVGAYGMKGTITDDEVKSLNIEFIKTQARLREIGVETDTVGNKIKEAFNSRTIQQVSRILLLAMVRALKKVYDNVKAINTAMTELQIVTNATANQMKVASSEIANSARKIGSSIQDLIKSTTVYARLGYNLKDAQTLAEKTTIYARVAGVNVNEATTNITGIIKAFDIGASGLESVLDQMIWIGNNFPISQAEIGEAMNNAASALVANGNTLQQAIGIVTAANATIQNVSKSSTAVRTIAARISGSKAELEDLGEDMGSIVATSALEAKMSAFGVAITDTNGELRSTYEILSDVAKIWDELTSVEQAAIAEMLAGTRQQSAFYSIIQNWSDAESIVKDAGNASGSLMEAQEIRLNSIEGKLEQIKAVWESVSNNLLDSGLVTMFLELIRVIGELLNAITGFGDGAVAKIALIIASVVGLITGIQKIIPIIQTLRLQFKLFSMELGVHASGIKGFLLTIGKSLKQFMAENSPILIIITLISFMTMLEGKAAGFTETIVGFITLIVSAVLLAFKAMDKTIKGFMISNPLGWILAAITAVVAVTKGIIDLIKSYNPSFEELKEAAKESVDAWKEVEEQLENTRQKIADVEKELERLNKIENKSLADENEIKFLKEKLELLKDEEKLQKANARAAQNDAMTKAERALDKLANKNSKKIANVSSNPTAVLGIINEYSNLLSEFEYGMNDHLDSYFDDYYKLKDKYFIATGTAGDVWSSIMSRTKYEGAVNALKDFANAYKNTSEITDDSIKELAEKTPEVKELFGYLQSIGFWNGDYSEEAFINSIKNIRTGLKGLTSIDIVQDIESTTDQFEALNKALSDIGKNGVVSLDNLSYLMEKYPSLLNKYFKRTSDGYKISDDYANKSNYEILESLAIDSLKEYQEILEKTQEEVNNLTLSDDDYETALKNLAIAQDNLNAKQLEWATLLRDAKIEEEIGNRESLKGKLEEQLDVYKELIEIRKDLLKTYKEELDYQKELNKKQQSVADLQTQLTLATLDTSAAGQARVRELEEELQKAQEELDEYTLEKAIDDVTNALDNEYAEYEKFIKQQVEIISEEIKEITKTLTNILSSINNSNNQAHTNEEMYNLYEELESKKKAGMQIDEDTQSFIDNVKNKNFSNADNLYSHAKGKLDDYKKDHPDNPTPKPPEKTDVALKMFKVEGAWGEGISKDKKGDNGEVHYKGVDYKIENGGNRAELYNAAYVENGFGDRNIFYYDGELYGCLDGSVVKLQQRAISYGKNHAEGYAALKKKILEDIPQHHKGGFVGDIVSLKSNEEFAKLLNGELVSTPKQMDNFIKRTLPSLIGYTNSSNSIINNTPLIEISCGNIDKNSLPQLKALTETAAKMIEEKMLSALSRTGYKKRF